MAGPAPRATIDQSTLSSIAEEIAAIRGVLVVFQGIRQRRGHWTQEPTLTVHVKRKRPRRDLRPEERLHRRFPHINIDVVAVGRPRLHAEVDSDDQLVAAYDRFQRKSAVSAMALDGDGELMALGSGHGLLPVLADGYQSGPADPSEDIHALSDPPNTDGFVAFGAVDQSVDFAVARFTTLKPPLALLGHTFSPPPIPLRSGDLALGEAVQHEAPRRGFRITGLVTGLRPQQPIFLHSDEGFDLPYADIFTVSNPNVAFSLPGESGSLVFDVNRRAVGFVVGGGKDPNDPSRTVTYVLRNFSALQAQMPDAFPRFFGA